MKRRLVFYVSKNDICKGLAGISNECPMALALNRLTGEYVCVGSSIVAIGDDIYFLSDEGKEFVARFDNHEPVYPQDFELTLKGE